MCERECVCANVWCMLLLDWLVLGRRGGRIQSLRGGVRGLVVVV